MEENPVQPYRRCGTSLLGGTFPYLASCHPLPAFDDSAIFLHALDPSPAARFEDRCPVERMNGCIVDDEILHRPRCDVLCGLSMTAYGRIVRCAEEAVHIGGIPLAGFSRRFPYAQVRNDMTILLVVNEVDGEDPFYPVLSEDIAIVPVPARGIQ